MNGSEHASATAVSWRWPWKKLQLASRGVWGHVIVAGLLITGIPSLILAWLWTANVCGSLSGRTTWVAVVGTMALVVASGYAILMKYPVNIRKLRGYVTALAENQIPDHVALSEDEDDLAAIQRHMEAVVHMAEERLRLLEERHAAEIKDEQRRVMVESIETMCHHLGQPAATLNLCLFQLAKLNLPDEGNTLIQSCEKSMADMSDIFDQLRSLSEYATEPYLDDSTPARLLHLQPPLDSTTATSRL